MDIIFYQYVYIHLRLMTQLISKCSSTNFNFLNFSTERFFSMFSTRIINPCIIFPYNLSYIYSDNQSFNYLLL